MNAAADTQTIAVIKKHQNHQGAVTAILADLQEAFGYLPEPVIRTVARELNRPLAEIYGVVTFYDSFSLKKRGRHTISVCTGTACHVRGAPRILHAFEAELGISEGETTRDGLFTLQTVRCMGACALGPVVMMDGRCFSRVSPDQIGQILASAGEKSEAPREDRHVLLRAYCPSCGSSLVDENTLVEGAPSIKVRGKVNGDTAWFLFAGIHGSNAMSADRPIEHGTIVELSCPHCLTDLKDERSCPECGTAMAVVKLGERSALRICPRIGSKVRLLEFDASAWNNPYPDDLAFRNSKNSRS